MPQNSVYKMKFREVYPLYVAKALRRGHTAQEVDEIICWLTGLTPSVLQAEIEGPRDMESFFTNAPLPNPNREQITGSVCGVKLAEIEDPIMREIRYLDKLIDELAKGKAMDKILRK